MVHNVVLENKQETRSNNFTKKKTINQKEKQVQDKNNQLKVIIEEVPKNQNEDSSRISTKRSSLVGSQAKLSDTIVEISKSQQTKGNATNTKRTTKKSENQEFKSLATTFPKITKPSDGGIKQ